MISNMEHKGKRLFVRIIGVVMLLDGMILIYTGWLGLHAFNIGDFIIIGIYGLTLINGILAFALACGLLGMKKWGFISFYVFVIIAWIISISSLGIGFVSPVSALIWPIILAFLALYLFYSQKIIFTFIPPAQVIPPTVS